MIENMSQNHVEIIIMTHEARSHEREIHKRINMTFVKLRNNNKDHDIMTYVYIINRFVMIRMTTFNNQKLLSELYF